MSSVCWQSVNFDLRSANPSWAPELNWLSGGWALPTETKYRPIITNHNCIDSLIVWSCDHLKILISVSSRCPVFHWFISRLSSGSEQKSDDLGVSRVQTQCVGFRWLNCADVLELILFNTKRVTHVCKGIIPTSVPVAAHHWQRNVCSFLYNQVFGWFRKLQIAPLTLVLKTSRQSWHVECCKVRGDL